MTVWRNSEGREFPSFSDDLYAMVDGVDIRERCMRALGYELVDSEEPEEFEVVCKSVDYGMGCLRSDRIIPGKTYLVREKA